MTAPAVTHTATPAPTTAPARPAGSAARGPRGLRARLHAWWVERLPRSDTWVLGQRNIYILPTKAGITFALTLLLMLLASINYQLNLGYALTFLLAGSGLVSMHQTHGNLRGLTLHLRPVQPVFAGDMAQLELVLTNPGHERHAVAMHWHDRGAHGQSFDWADVPRQGQAIARLTFVPPARGLHPLPTVMVETGFPFGLFRAWTLWRPATPVLAWPRPEELAPPLPAAAPRADARLPTHRRHDGAELDGVRAWRRGDPLRQIVWKKVARTGELVSRDSAGSASRVLALDWQAARGADAEARLSRLAAWVVAADRQNLAFSLELPGHTLALAHGDAHRRAALDALALWSA